MTLDDLLDFDQGYGAYAEDTRGTPASVPYFNRGGPSSQLARVRMGATRLGISEEAYLAHMEAGEKWCGYHRDWHPNSAFGPSTRTPDGLQKSCRKQRNAP